MKKIYTEMAVFDKSYIFIICLFFIINCFFMTYSMAQKISYPETKKIDQFDNYHGTRVHDPYRWLEDGQSPETQKWIAEQNKTTFDYLKKIPYREKIRQRLTELWNYERYASASKIGDDYIFYKNNGLQEQSVVYIQKGKAEKPEVFLDPNTLSQDGSISLTGLFFSNDFKYAAYMVSHGGSDWREIFVMDVQTRKLLADKIQWVKFSGVAWYKDGFYYSRYDEPKAEDKLKGVNRFQKLYYHKLGTEQSQDTLVLEDKKNSKRGFGAMVTDDEQYLIVSVWESASGNNLLWYKDLEENTPFIKIIDQPDGQFFFIDSLRNQFLLLTNKNAPKNKVVLVDLEKPSMENWKTILPESADLLQRVSYIGGKLIATYLKDATNKICVFSTEGNYLYDIALPSLGSVNGFWGKESETETFYTFTSFTYPNVLYRYDVSKNQSYAFQKSQLKFDMEGFETKQVFYKSKDGVQVPLFIVHKKGLEPKGDSPTLLYGYGGFNNSVQPNFSVSRIPFLEKGGVYAVACLRGGSEYGEEWHKAGMREKKQNVFDDFIAAAEWLISNKYTNKERLSIQGVSNGGLLVGAVMNQRNDLFKVAFPRVGVMDMLRFHKFTIGWAWTYEYGSSENKDQFPYLYAYSPLHNIRELEYPATLVATADHDDRVYPAHSFKYIATLQEKNTGKNPVLIRIETKVGHGTGTSTSKSIDLETDFLSFLLYNMGLDY